MINQLRLFTVYIAKLIISGRQKIAMALLLAAVFLFLAYFPRVTEALLAFCLGGVVPGTDIIVSPDMVLLFVSVVLGTSFIALAVRIYFNAMRRRNFVQIPVRDESRPLILKLAAAVVEAEEPLKHPRKADHKALPRRSRMRLVFALMSRTVARLSYRFGAWTRHATRIAGKRSKQALRAIGIGLDTFLGLVWIGTHNLVTFIYRSSKVGIKATITGSRTAWRWLIPRLHRLDAWLEVQVRRLETRA